MKHLQKVLNMFGVTGEKATKICFLIEALKTVQSASIKSERALPAARLFITKLWDKTSMTAASNTFPLGNHIKKIFLNIAL